MRSPELKREGSRPGGNALPVGKGREPMRPGVSPRDQSSAGVGAKVPGPGEWRSRLAHERRVCE